MGCKKQSHAIIIILLIIVVIIIARPGVIKVRTDILDLPRAVLASSLIWGHDENPAAWFLWRLFLFFLSQAACVYKQMP